MGERKGAKKSHQENKDIQVRDEGREDSEDVESEVN